MLKSEQGTAALAIVYLNGRYIPEASATVSVLDRGFIFGDGVYEVIPVFGSHILRFSEHLARLGNSLAGIYLDNPHAEAEWRDIVATLLERNPGAENRSVYLQVTRGAGERGHVPSKALLPTVFAMCNPIPERDYTRGVSAITHEDIRWQYCNIKVTSLLPNVLLRHRAKERDGSTEAILLRGDRVTEGAASNVFVVHGRRVATPPKDHSLLPGITRDLVVDLLRGAKLGCEEAKITRADLVSADELWITSSMMGIAPVTRLDGRPVGQGQPGAVWREADAIYQAFKVKGVGGAAPN
ncbi:MAG: aminotransferase class IV [Gammaproteobacteria bacterium]|nr:aminotransferase class IV [Gammaproteobacteria bacterium]